MIPRTSSINVSDTDYQEPQPIQRVVPPTTIRTTPVRQDDIASNA